MRYEVQIANNKLIVTNPQGEQAVGFITETGSYGAKTKKAFLALKVADKHINLKQIIKEETK